MSLPTLRIIGFIIGIFLITLAISMIVPMATLVIYDRLEDLRSFLWASAITFIAGSPWCCRGARNMCTCARATCTC